MTANLTDFEAPLQLMVQLLTQAQAVAEIVARLHAEKRSPTAEDLDALVRADDDARRYLQEAIDAVRRAAVRPDAPP